jgi:hypothetical protein
MLGEQLNDAILRLPAPAGAGKDVNVRNREEL